MPLGSGKINYTDATHITIDNLYFENSNYIAGSVLKVNCALVLDYYSDKPYPKDRLEYHVTFKGGMHIVQRKKNN